MSTTEQSARPTVGAEGAPCTNCGSPLAADQRYCLECGTRRGDARLPYERYLATGSGVAGGPPASAPAANQSNEVSPLGAILGVALLGGMLLIGVLLGRGDNDEAPGPATVVQESAATTTPSENATTEAPVTSEWPAGDDGFTIELGTLPKSGTTSADVEATKADLESQGATGLGVLDSDLYPSLPAGNYVIYSGVYDSKGAAKGALPGLTAALPSAKVIEVSQTSGTGGGTDPESGGAGESGSEQGGNDAATLAPSGDDAAAQDAAEQLEEEAAAALEELDATAPSDPAEGEKAADEQTPVTPPIDTPGADDAESPK